MRLEALRAGAAMTALGLLGACSAPGDGKPHAEVDHFRCAAMIGAADKLRLSGGVPRDTELDQRGLIAAMTHLNAYATPKKIREKEAFAAVNAERDRLVASVPPAEILAAAKACL